MTNLWLHDLHRATGPHFLYRRYPIRKAAGQASLLVWRFHGLTVGCLPDDDHSRCGLESIDADATCLMPALMHDGPHIGQPHELLQAVGPLVVTWIEWSGDRVA